MPKRPWQFGLSTLFALTTFVAVVMASLRQGYLWWVLAAAIVGNAVLFAVIVGLYDIEGK